jgi:hypothetical protein
MTYALLVEHIADAAISGNLCLRRKELRLSDTCLFEYPFIPSFFT